MSKALRLASGPFGRVALLDMDRSLVRHAHPHCHVLLKIDGDDTQFLVGDRIAPLTDTQAVLINAWETHAYVHDPARRNAMILALYIEPEWLRQFRPNWIASGAPGFFARPAGEVDARIRRLTLDLAGEMVHGDPAGGAREFLLSELMIAVIRRVEKAVVKVVASQAPLAEIGAWLGFQSPGHFSRFFRDHVSVAPREFRSVLLRT
jgi:hypothetical protein